MTLRRWFLLAILSVGLGAQSLALLPEWAAPHVPAASEPAPEGAAAWVLFHRVELAYLGDGEVRTRTCRLVKVLTSGGVREGVLDQHLTGGGASTLQAARGWNLRPDGRITVLNRRDLVSVGMLATGQENTDTRALGELERVVPGSLVAFETLETHRLPIGAVASLQVMGAHPVRRWEVGLAKAVGWFTATRSGDVRMLLDPSGLEGWAVAPERGEGTLAFSRVPAWPEGEGFAPHPFESSIRVGVRFVDPRATASPTWEDWNSLAVWVQTKFKVRALDLPDGGLRGSSGREALEAIHAWMARNLSYRAIYLSPEQAWAPNSPEAILRARFGDCKDLSALLLALAQGGGLEGVPVLARIGGGGLSEATPPGAVFDHALAAVRLTETWGLPAEVATPHGRFLLVDPTSPTTPLGRLPWPHRGGRVLLCGRDWSEWVSVPEAATGLGHVTVRLEAGLNAAGDLEGTLTCSDGGEALGLRAVHQRSGLAGLRRDLERVLGLSPWARWTLDPPAAEPGSTFTVTLRLRMPSPLTARGSAFLLPPVGLPGIPAPAQRAGRARTLPLLAQRGAVWDYQARLRLTPQQRPAGTCGSLDTPFRTAAWSARMEDGQLLLSFRQEDRDARFEGPRREEGVTAQLRDRQALAAALEDLLRVRGDLVP